MLSRYFHLCCVFCRNGLNATGLGIVHIKFQEDSMPQFEHTVILTWFDLLGILGGICSITIGGSIISFIELLYFFTGRFGVVYMRRLFVLIKRYI